MPTKRRLEEDLSELQDACEEAVSVLSEALDSLENDEDSGGKGEEEE